MTSSSIKTPVKDSPEQRQKLSGILHLTSIAGRFDKTRDVALGPHCFIGRVDVFPEWGDMVFPEAFDGEAAMEINERNLRGLTNHLLPGLVERLNAYHGTSHSVDFWRILIMPWLVELSQKVWVSFLRLQQVAERYGDRALTVNTYHDKTEWHLEDTVGFFTTMLRDYRFSWWIDSEVVAAIKPATWRLQPTDPIDHPTPPVALEPPPAYAAGKIRGILRNLKYRLGYSDILGIRWSGLALAVYANLLPKSPSRMHFHPDPDFHPEPFFPRPFLDTLDRLIDATMPKSFLDGFPALAGIARRLPYRPGRLRLGTLSHWNEKEKIIAAFAKEAGEKRVCFQHGGEYGMLKYNMGYNELEGNLCIFISWGWNYNDPSGNYILPLPSPFHGKIANCHRPQNDNLIVVGLPIRILLNRIHWWNLNNTPIRYCNETIHFLESLSAIVRRSVLFRPYVRAANDIDIRDIVSARFPNMRFLETSLHDEMMKCRLLVHAAFGTTLNHAMAANVPSIVYLAPNLMVPREEAEPYFEPLRKCGIIHDSPEAAAAHINKIWGDVEGWWLSDEVQQARKIWSHQFARTDRFWWWQWIKALAKLKDVG